MVLEREKFKEKNISGQEEYISHMETYFTMKMALLIIDDLKWNWDSSIGREKLLGELSTSTIIAQANSKI